MLIQAYQVKTEMAIKKRHRFRWDKPIYEKGISMFDRDALMSSYLYMDGETLIRPPQTTPQGLHTVQN